MLQPGGELICKAIPGVLEYEGARIQLLDLPGIVQDAAKGE
jgi:ribosome-interacting GTPase 1